MGRVAEAIAVGKCSIALITLAGTTRTEPPPMRPGGPEIAFETALGGIPSNTYAMCAMRHMDKYSTTSEQLAWVKVAVSDHTRYNEHAFLRKVVTVE